MGAQGGRETDEPATVDSSANGPRGSADAPALGRGARGPRNQRRARGEAAGAEPDISDTKPAGASNFAFSKILRGRLQKAELGKYGELLAEYCQELDEREARSVPLGATTAAPRDDDEEAWNRTTAFVLGDAVGRAKHALLAEPRPPKNEATAAAMEELTCVPVDQVELQAIQ